MIHSTYSWVRGNFTVISLSLLVACWSSHSIAAISGRAILQGTPPPEKKIQMDSLCASLNPHGVTTRHYAVSKSRGLADVVVYVKEGLSIKAHPAPTNAVTVNFARCLVEPYISPVQVGQTIEFVNRDVVLHNIHIVPKINRESNFAVSHGTQSITRSIPVAEAFIRIKCDVHPWEFGYLSVFDHPFFAVTDAEGNFQLPPGLPDGKYVLEAQHVKAGKLVTNITVEGGRAVVPEFVFRVPDDVRFSRPTQGGRESVE